MPRTRQPRPAPVDTLFDLLPIGAYRSAPDGRQLRANAALVRLNGYDSEAEMLAAVQDIGREWYVDAGRRQRFEELLAQDGQVRAFVSEVYRHRTRERIWVSENAHVVRAGDGSVVYYEGTVEEVTAHIAAQSGLQRDLEYLRQIAEHIPGMVYRAHYPPRREVPAYYTFVSGGVRRLFGVEPEAVMADPQLLRRFRHPDDVARVDRQVRQAIIAGAPLDVEYRLLVDGRVRWVQLSSSVAGQEGGEQVRVGVLLDVTARVRAAELSRERDSAENERQQMTRFLSRVSHELRTPLNAILGFAQLIEMDVETPPSHRHWVAALLASGRHLLDLVNEVLDIAGAQSGQMVFDLAEVDLAAALRDSWAMVQPQGAGPLVGGLPEPGAAAVPVRADRRRLVQVLTNLLSNAVKYNRPGGRIDLALRPAADAVELDIGDTGVGIGAEQLERLFTPFERLGAQRGTVPGTGLGLALSRQLVLGMGGALTVASEPGVGSTFTLRLPRART